MSAFRLATADATRHILHMPNVLCRPRPRLLVIGLGMCLVVLLASACGRKGDPEPPPGSDYPRTYPSR